MTSACAHRPTPGAIRIVLGHSQALYREGLRRLLLRADFDLLAVAGAAAELAAAAATHRPDVVIADPACGAGLRRHLPDVRVLLIANRLDVETATELASRGTAGIGYLLEGHVADVEHFTGAIRCVAAGGTMLDPPVVAVLLGHAPDPLGELTERERDVLAQVAAGRSNLGVAKELDVSEHAVEKHVSRVLAKLRIPEGRANNRRVLAALALHHDAV
ncbi:response regulator transcription factor [Solirubrobacter soli]|uniref:response regulator transcription factor n=1 Tax=Solirubrobacter soli TaxID=363832 RepID=UPI0004128899|nr:LuxR C-terminal-related transcriptional regulator [Solirubrobacter soli]